MKYKYGTILKFTSKALKQHSNKCEPNERMIVVGENECILYNNVDKLNTYANPPITIPKNTILMFDMYRKFDSYVEPSNEDMPQLNFDKTSYHDLYIEKEKLEKYIKDFNINMITEFEKHLIKQ